MEKPGPPITYIDDQTFAVLEGGEDPVEVSGAYTTGKTGVIDVTYLTAIDRAVIESAGDAVIVQIERLKGSVVIGRKRVVPCGVVTAIEGRIEVHMSVSQRIQHAGTEIKKCHLVTFLERFGFFNILIVDSRPVDIPVVAVLNNHLARRIVCRPEQVFDFIGDFHFFLPSYVFSVKICKEPDSENRIRLVKRV